VSKVVWQGQGGVAVTRRSDKATYDLAVFGLRRDIDNRLTFGVIDLGRWAVGVRAVGTWRLDHVPLVPVVTVGLDAQQQRDDRMNRSLAGAETTLRQYERVSEVGPFLQAALALGPDVTLSAGARFDAVGFRVDDRLFSDGDQSGGRTMQAVSGTAGVVARLWDYATPWINVSSAFETPTTTELVNRPDGGGGLNPVLEPQRARSVELGVRGRANRVVRYELVGYHVAVSNALIPFEDPVQPGRRFFRNAASIRSRGIELGVDAVGSLVAVAAAYTWSDNTYVTYRAEADTLDGNTVPGVPHSRLQVVVRGGRPRGGVWGVLEQTFTSAYHVDDANTEEVGASWVTTVRAGWRGVLGRVEAGPFLAMLNVFDRAYSGSVVVNASGRRYYEPAPGRHVLVGAEVRF
jgi:iron complex outermembrane receptor protein